MIKKLKKPLIADDTAIYFQEYISFPGTFTKFVFNSIGFKGIEKLLKNKNRKAFFQTLICYTDGKDFKVFKGRWKGKIIKNINKNINRPFNPDWQYNNIFVPENYSIPLSEIPLEKRIKSSHRRKALKKLVKYLKVIK